MYLITFFSQGKQFNILGTCSRAKKIREVEDAYLPFNSDTT